MITLLKDIERKPCSSCECKIGDHHVPGCGIERCPKCKRQLISCDCFIINNDEGSFFDEKELEKYFLEKWSGIFYEEEIKYCEKNDLYVYWDKQSEKYVNCDKDHPLATHDINTAYRHLRISKIK